MNNFFDNQRILNLIWNRKFHFITIGIAAIILSAIFSGSAFIQPKYKSTARIYPINLAVLSEESETEQMLEILNSNDIKLKMFDAFNLDEVYRINKTDEHYLTYMFNIYNDNVNTSKTEYETVELKVMDESPKRASEMCDSIIHFYNRKIGNLHSLKYKEVANITKEFVELKTHELDSISNLLQNLRDKTEIISYSSQIKSVTEGYMLALSENNGGTSDTKIIKKQLDNLKDFGAQAYILEKKFNKLNGIVDSLTLVKDIALMEANKKITYSHIVESPFPADKKSYPVRWLIVAFSTLSAVFLALLVFLVLDYRKEE